MLGLSLDYAFKKSISGNLWGTEGKAEDRSIAQLTYVHSL